MKVYFIRHTDWHERLGRFSPEGKLQIERMVKSIRGMGLAGADVIVFVSPLPRAMATARVVCREIGCNSVTELPWLADDAKLEDVKSGFGFISRLKFFGDMKTFVLVGHRPTLEFLIKFLTTQNVEVGNGDVWEVNLNTKTAAKIE